MYRIDPLVFMINHGPELLTKPNAKNPQAPKPMYQQFAFRP